MMNKPLVSIIIPTYNRAHMLKDTLEHIQKQTYTNWECLIIDDGSQDDTNDVVHAFAKADSRISFHNRPAQTIKGANACRNYGLEISKGDFINWFDSDDLMMPSKIEKQIEIICSTKTALNVCQTIIYDKQNKQEIGLRSEAVYSNDFFNDYINFKIFWTTGAALWERKFLEKHKMSFDNTLQQSQDYDFHIRSLYVLENYSIIDIPLMYLVLHDHNMSNSVTDNDDKLLSNITVRYQVLKELNSALNNESRLTLYHNMVGFFKQCLRLGKKKMAFKIYLRLLLVINKIPLRTPYKLSTIAKYTMALFSYAFTNRGDRYLRE